MARSRWSRWVRPMAVVLGLMCLGNTVYWIWRVVSDGPSFPVVFPAGTWLVMTIGWILILVRGPNDDDGQSENLYLSVP